MPRDIGSGRPTKLKVLAGTQKSRINRDEPQPETGIPVCPSKLPAVREVWDYTIRQLEVMQVVTMADRDALHVYCQAVVHYREALEVIEAEGHAIEGSHGGLVRHPAWATAKEAASLIKAFGTVFGLSPGARSAIKVADQKKPREQGAARLLSG